jgi:hypothetical protein
MLRMLRNIPVHFQWLPLAPGDSTRHGRDMKAKKKTPPSHLDQNLALAFFGGLAIVADYLRQAGISPNDPLVAKATASLIDDLKDQYARKVRAQALRLRKHWRKADVPRLLQLAGDAREATQRKISQTLLAKDKTGRGVVPAPKTFDEALRDGCSLWSRIADPATSLAERRKLARQSPLYPRLIEAAYRGELEKAKRKVPDRSLPHHKPSEIAEDAVAQAAGLSIDVVHQIIYRARQEDKQALKWAASQPDRWVEPDPAITAAQLKRHLELS